MNKKEVEFLRQKDEKTFEKFYSKYHKLIFTIIYNKVYSFSIAEELVQETFMQVMKDINQYNGGSFKYWVVTISKNIANMYLRKEITLKEKFEEYKETLILEEDSCNINSNELLDRIKGIVGIETYEIIVLRLVRNFKFKDIAQIKGKTTSVVLGKYHRGMKLIRSKINYEEN